MKFCDPELRRAAIRLIMEGHTRRDAAQAVGISTINLSQYMRMHGIRSGHVYDGRSHNPPLIPNPKRRKPKAVACGESSLGYTNVVIPKNPVPLSPVAFEAVATAKEPTKLRTQEQAIPVAREPIRVIPAREPIREIWHLQHTQNRAFTHSYRKNCRHLEYSKLAELSDEELLVYFNSVASLRQHDEKYLLEAIKCRPKIYRELVVVQQRFTRQ